MNNLNPKPLSPFLLLVVVLGIGSLLYWALNGAMPGLKKETVFLGPPDPDCASVTHDVTNELRRSLLNYRIQTLAFEDLLKDHYALQALHRDSMQWGPLRSPRQCVRETLLMEQDYWPKTREAELADAMDLEDRLRNEAREYRQALSQCERAAGVPFPDRYQTTWWDSMPANEGAHAIYPEGVADPDSRSCPPGSMSCPCIDGFECNGYLECSPHAWAPEDPREPQNGGACF